MAFDTLNDPRAWIPHILPTLERSPLYTCWAEGMADDAQTAQLLTWIDPDQPSLILLFTVVNYLVLKEPQQALARFYPCLTRHPAPAQDAYPVFRAFCHTSRETLRQILPRTRLQTNEVTRCANLLPAFHLVAERAGGKPLALLEIGCSAGLNLRWFDYGYTYDTFHVGSATSPVQLHCDVPEHVLPALSGIPDVATCQGIDLAPLNIHRGEDVLWLKAHIWPEEVWRYGILDAAITFNRQHPSQIWTGNAVHLLPELLAHVPLEQTLCLFHSFALHQGPAEVQRQIEQHLLHASSARTIYDVSLEVYPERRTPLLGVATYHHGSVQHEVLAECAHHGERMIWLLPA